jgi:hypothetical protein
MASLSRRSSDIEHPKSVAAARKAKEMNADMNITAFEEKMCTETEAQFGDEFFTGLTAVCNALDNVHARLYVRAKRARRSGRPPGETTEAAAGAGCRGGGVRAKKRPERRSAPKERSPAEAG